MASGPQNLAVLYSDLNKSINVADYKQALKAANKILHTKEGNNEVKAMQCKVVCFLQISQFAEALKFIESNEEIRELLVFEKAYCQYRLLKTEEALETVNNIKDVDNRLLELKAQILYKLGRYNESCSIYKRLMKDCSDDYEEERMTNFSAVHAALSSFENTQTDMGFKAESYEQLYNRACWLLGRNKIKEAQDTLEQAESACRDFYSDDPDMTPEEIEAEISIIRVQLGYALQLQGKDDDALTIYNQVIRSRPTDLGIVAVASNNIICINKEQNVFDSRKKMKATIVNGVEKKLVPYQKRIIDFNRALLFMYSSQWEACRKLLKSLLREHKSSEIPCLIQAAQLCRERNASKAVEYLQTFIIEKSDPDISTELDLTNIKLALVQLLLSQGELAKSCQILESMTEICYSPGVVSCLVALYNAQSGGAGSASKLMDRAIEWHKKNKSPRETLIELMWESAMLNLQHKNPQKAADALEAMLRFDPKNVKVLAKLVFVYSQFDTAKAQEISEDLPSLAELSVHVDVDELERNATRMAPRYVKKQKEKKENVIVETVKKNLVSEGSATPEVRKTKKKKKNPVPKNFQPNYTPDPERWNPLRERSYYKGRRKDRKKGVGKGTQGTNFSAAESYDMSHKTAPVVSQPTPNSPKAGSASGSQGSTPLNSPKPTQVPKGGKKQVAKKKKKGKRGW